MALTSASKQSCYPCLVIGYFEGYAGLGGTHQISMILPPAGRSASLNPKSVSMRRVASILGCQPILSPRNLVAS
jgi:hypothetical protein